MLSQLRAAVVSLLAMTIITGIAYPLLVTGIAQAAFPHEANGSLVRRGDKILGSRLIGQPFDDPRYFWGRLSATTDANAKPLAYNAASSLGSNLGPSNPALVDEVKGRVDALHSADPASAAASDGTSPASPERGRNLEVPVDLVTSSGSGLDPDISPAAALFQVHRVALARGIGEGKLRAFVESQVEGRQLGFLGEPRVNVLELNLALDGLK
jgi:potassium-transporting ATPase KdpC subunit